LSGIPKGSLPVALALPDESRIPSSVVLVKPFAKDSDIGSHPAVLSKASMFCEDVGAQIGRAPKHASRFSTTRVPDSAAIEAGEAHAAVIVAAATLEDGTPHSLGNKTLVVDETAKSASGSGAS